MNSGLGKAFLDIEPQKYIRKILAMEIILQLKIIDNCRHESNMDIFRIKNMGNGLKFLI